MKKIALILVLVSLQVHAQKKFKISSEIFHGSTEEFLPHFGTGYWDTYLSMELPFRPASYLFYQLLKSKKPQKQFISRGEAHITVVTPVEFQEQLKDYISGRELNRIGYNAGIQKANFNIKCLGGFKKQLPLNKDDPKLGTQLEATYFIVVKSQKLLEIREEILKIAQARAKKRGLPIPTFKPSDYEPHITIGFTKRDMHKDDGAVKTIQACGRNSNNLSVF